MESTIALAGFSLAYVILRLSAVAQGLEVPSGMPTTLEGTVILICVASVLFFMKSSSSEREDRKEMVKGFNDSLSTVMKEATATREVFMQTTAAFGKQHDADRQAWLASVEKQNDRLDEFGSEIRHLTDEVRKK